ncbi:hypothetical protein LX36DRAFT_675716 [Colletotrichum falcatum]|nr:hypothetical protein LX36DRAFT_675716 [Colletotrichum falcatum]
MKVLRLRSWQKAYNTLASQLRSHRGDGAGLLGQRGRARQCYKTDSTSKGFGTSQTSRNTAFKLSMGKMNIMRKLTDGSKLVGGVAFATPSTFCQRGVSRGQF